MNKEQLKAKYGNEKVLVVPFDKLIHIGDGFTPIQHNKELWKQFDSDIFAYRYDVEGEPSVQQIIPYILLFNKNKDKIYSTRRINGDHRLLNKISIACGGHIDSSDAGQEVLFKAATRELMEEATVTPIEPFNIIGYVREMNSNTNDHTGVVITVIVDDEVIINEKDTLVGEWMDKKELINHYNQLENWSKFILDYLIENNKI